MPSLICRGLGFAQVTVIDEDVAVVVRDARSVRALAAAGGCV